tara:strand:- start:3073 stop:3357 length:285 start_codon:yes stop_codon:yes gene_type:complete
MTEIEEVKDDCPYKRTLTIEDEESIRKMMEHNPVIDRILAETICLMPPEDLKDICDKRKEGTLKDPYPNKEFVAVYKTGVVEPEPEPDISVIEE